MNKYIKDIIIIVIIVVGGGVGYLLLFGNSKDTNSNSSLSISDSSLSSSNVDAQISEDTAFLSTLLGLSNIKIDPQLFLNKTFSSLSDNTVEIVNNGVIGRTNPFAPLEGPETNIVTEDTGTLLPPINEPIIDIKTTTKKTTSVINKN